MNFWLWDGNSFRYERVVDTEVGDNKPMRGISSNKQTMSTHKSFQMRQSQHRGYAVVGLSPVVEAVEVKSITPQVAV